jgi:predicted enzyme related to lactoylglutathione lyase
MKKNLYTLQRVICFWGLLVLLTAGSMGLTGCASKKTASLPAITPTPTGQQQVGKFVWFDLLTEDVQAAQNFYGELFGWQFKTKGKSSGYIVINSGDKPIGGIVPYNKESVDQESIWLASLSVEDVDRAVSATKARFGKVLDAPVDVKGRGRMAVIRDPEGAELVLIRAASGDPADAAVNPGEWLWVDLFTRDAKTANDFYAALAGYTAETVKTEKDHSYNLLKRNDRAFAGVVELPWEDVEPNWLPYIKVEDLEETITQAEKLGGVLILRLENVAVIADPSGGAFGIQMVGRTES